MADDQANEGGSEGGVVKAIGSVFGWIAGLLEPARHFVVNLGVLTGLMFGGPAVYKMAAKSTFVIKDISVPGTLSGRGFTGEVVGHQILDHIAEIDREAGSRKEKAEISGIDINRSMPSINLPVGGLNIAAVVSEMRALFGYSETKVTGEIFIADTGDPAKGSQPLYGLRLRIAGQGPIYRSEQPSPTIEPLIEAAAQTIMRRYDPINLGYYYYRKKSYRRALALTDEVLANGSNDDLPWAHVMRGLIARDQGQYAEAAAELRETLALAPKFSLGHVTLASVLRLDGQLEQAEASARAAIELSPAQYEGHGMLALVLMDRGKRDEALAEMQKGIEVDGKNANGHLELGRLLARLDRREDALAAFKTAAALKAWAEPLFEAVAASKALKRDGDVIAHLRRATQVEPKNPQTWLALGEAQLERNQHTRAAQTFGKAVTLDPDRSETILRAVRALDAQKRFTDADQLLAQASARVSRNPNFLLGWSEHAWAAGRKHEAGVKLKEALASEGANAAMLENAGRILEARGELVEALEAYKRAVALEPRLERSLRASIERLSAPPPVAAVAVEPVPVPTPPPATTASTTPQSPPPAPQQAASPSPPRAPAPQPSATKPAAEKTIVMQPLPPVTKQAVPRAPAQPREATQQPWAPQPTPAARAPRPPSQPASSASTPQ